jgi:hypothetical protein
MVDDDDDEEDDEDEEDGDSSHKPTETGQNKKQLACFLS